ncbi:hypothetical protein VCUG_00671 [Vavraia culicis subsp. floridensis]|uniref:Uncharacterized protein n=1 Tax=Vavraia culicis (isolate floridensis) TaxID=948595 RepID=L2GW21_VAVCU|nr:uncharacterized protein VCUG_00671 [Vavraia culicis subsp. floridensis]ELA47829.1 hypothetical protein VCUG_00671 [Vavraia culicis subsp. floridensis]
MPESEKKEETKKDEVKNEEPQKDEAKNEDQPTKEESSKKSSVGSKTSVKNAEPVEEKPEETKKTEIPIPKMKNEKMQQKGVLMQNDILTIQVDDMVDYIKNRKDMENLKEGERLEPFIIFLNSRFISTVKHNIRMKRAKTGIVVVLLLIVVSVICFFLGKIVSS